MRTKTEEKVATKVATLGEEKTTCPPHFFIIPPGEYTGTCKRCGLTKEFKDFDGAKREKILLVVKLRGELKMWRRFQFPRTRRIVQPAKRVML